MITAGQRSGQKHLASLPGPSRLTTRMKRIGRWSWNLCMSMHGKLGRKSKTMTAWGPLGTSWNFVKGKWSNREVFLFHSWLKISDLNLKGCLQRRNTEVQDQCHCPVCCTDKFCSQTPTRLEKRSQPFVGLKLFTWITDISISQPEILWEDLLDTLWILKCLAAVHWLVHQTTWVMWKVIINMHQFIHTQLDWLKLTNFTRWNFQSTVSCCPVSESPWSAPQCSWLLPPAGFQWLWWL